MVSARRPLFEGTPPAPADLVADYQQARRATEWLCAPLAIEDYVVQAMPNVSPAKWHLAHVTWFFETFLLQPNLAHYRRFNPDYAFLFNSYYNDAGPQFTRANRGLLSRPTVEDVYKYRGVVYQAMLSLFEAMTHEELETLGSVATLGLNHEQQHQELLLTDIKYNLSINPLRPAYHDRALSSAAATPPLRWVRFEEGLQTIGHGGAGFAFDNEWPRHQTYIVPFYLASRPVTNEELMDAEGYQRSELWLSEGWKAVQAGEWCAPLYWERIHDQWWYYTLSGMQPVDKHAPVTHVSYYEADAYARWRGKRLPTEQEWEYAAAPVVMQGNLQESGAYQPLHSPDPGSGLTQMIGDVWEWTQSPYTAYPGFRPWEGAIGEYNGKFMVNQMILRGGSCVTPASHIRATYRNFFPPDARWQFSGIRLASDA